MDSPEGAVAPSTTGKPGSEQPGRIIAGGRYELVRSIGSGATGEVYLALDRELERRQVAVKILSPRLANDEIALKRFKREVLLARELKHPNIVHMHEFCISHGERETAALHFVVMEYIQGSTLRALLEANRDGLPFQEALKILSAILSGISHAHGHGVIHRDLKPENILISHLGEIKIADFGASRALIQEETATAVGECVGSPMYMSPEQILGQDLDVRADLYSFGCLAFELVTGRKAFFHENLYALVSLHLKQPFPKCSKPGVPKYFSTLIAKCAAKDKADRFASADAVTEALAQCHQEKNSGFVGTASTVLEHLRRYAWIPLLLSACIAAFAVISRQDDHMRLFAAAPFLILEQYTGMILDPLRTAFGVDKELYPSYLLQCALHNHEFLASVLLDLGTPPNFDDRPGSRPLLTALQYRQVETAKVLARAGADVNSGRLQEESDDPPLAVALRHLDTELVSNLIEAPGFEVNRRYKDGNTPLMLIASFDLPVLTDQLLKLGADPNLENARGLTAMEIAIEQKQVAQFFMLLFNSQSYLLANPNRAYKSLVIALTTQQIGALGAMLQMNVGETIVNLEKLMRLSIEMESFRGLRQILARDMLNLNRFSNGTQPLCAAITRASERPPGKSHQLRVIIADLLAAGADPLYTDINSIPPYLCAMLKGEYLSLSLLNEAIAATL